MSDWTVRKALERIRSAKEAAAEGLSIEEYRQLLEELVADAQGWRMELDEHRDS